jgi:tetratricopeptide (TPR) repeat protein
MKRQTLGVVLALGVLGAVSAAFVAARSNRQKALLASLPPIDVSRFNPSARLLVEETLERLKAEPLRVDRWAEMGYALGANGVFTEPGPCFLRAEELDPTNHRWPHLYAVAVIKTDRAAAIAALKRAQKLQPNVIPTLGLLAEAYLEEGADAEADALLRPLVTEKTNDQRMLWLMARIEANAGAVDRALELARRAAAQPPHRRQVHTLLSQLYQRKGDTERARKQARLLELLPPSEEESPWPDPVAAQVYKYSRTVDFIASTARGLIGGGDYTEALRLLEELAPEDRDTPAIRAATAMAKAHLGEIKSAEELLDGSPDPNDPNVMFSRGVIALLQQKHAEAADVFLAIAQQHPEGARVRAVDGVHYNRAICLMTLKKEDEAIAAFEQTIKLNPGNYEALLRLADIYLQKNRKADAARLLADAALLEPNDERLEELQRRAAS